MLWHATWQLFGSIKIYIYLSVEFSAHNRLMLYLFALHKRVCCCCTTVHVVVVIDFPSYEILSIAATLTEAKCQLQSSPKIISFLFLIL